MSKKQKAMLGRILIGAALFVASDLTLLHNTLRKAPVSCHFFSLGMYYMGQLLLGLSAFSTP